MYVTASVVVGLMTGGAMVGAQPKESRLPTPTNGGRFIELPQDMNCIMYIPPEKVFIVLRYKMQLKKYGIEANIGSRHNCLKLY